jgi:hypothetical protein
VAERGRALGVNTIVGSVSKGVPPLSRPSRESAWPSSRTGALRLMTRDARRLKTSRIALYTQISDAIFPRFCLDTAATRLMPQQLQCSEAMRMLQALQ